jgi:hypothetical protein
MSTMTDQEPSNFDHEMQFRRPYDVMHVSEAVERELNRDENRPLQFVGRQEELKHIVGSAVSLLQYAGAKRAVSDILEYGGKRIRVEIQPEPNTPSGDASDMSLADELVGLSKHETDQHLHHGEEVSQQQQGAKTVDFSSMWE